MGATPAISANMYAPGEMKELFAMVARLGAGAAEISFGAAEDVGAKELGRMARKAGVELVMAVSFVMKNEALAANTEKLKKAVFLAGELGARVVNLYCSAKEGVGGEEAREVFCRMVEAVLPRAGVILTLENELSSRPGTFALFEHWRWLAERLPEPFGLTLDLGNFFASGNELTPEDVKPLVPRIRHLHVKDVAPLTEELEQRHPTWRSWEGARGSFLGVPPGRGAVDYPRFLEMLAEYSGYCTLEPFREEEPFRQGLEFLRKHGFVEV